MSAPSQSVEARFNAHWYGAALAYYGHPADFPGTFRPGPSGLELCHAATASMAGSPVWTTVNTPTTAFQRRKTHLADIAVVSTITLEGEYPPDPSRAHALAQSLRDALVLRGLIVPGTAIEDSGAGFHFSVPIPSLDVAALGGGVVVNEAIRRVVLEHIMPVFAGLASAADLTGKVGLGSYDIARILSFPGTWRPGGMKEADAHWLASGYQRRWLTPHETTPPVRVESPALGYLIRLACPVVAAEIAEAARLAARTAQQAPGPTDRDAVANWLWAYAGKLPPEDRSGRFHRIVWAASLKYGGMVVEEHAALIDELTGKKYGARALKEVQRSLATVAARASESQPPISNKSSDRDGTLSAPPLSRIKVVIGETSAGDFEPSANGPPISNKSSDYARVRESDVVAEVETLRAELAAALETIANLRAADDSKQRLLDRLEAEAPGKVIERLNDEVALWKARYRTAVAVIECPDLTFKDRVVSTLALDVAAVVRVPPAFGVAPEPIEPVHIRVGELERRAGVAPGTTGPSLIRAQALGFLTREVRTVPAPREGALPHKVVSIGPGTGAVNKKWREEQQAIKAAKERSAREEEARREELDKQAEEERRKAAERAHGGCLCGGELLPTGYVCGSCQNRIAPAKVLALPDHAHRDFDWRKPVIRPETITQKSSDGSYIYSSPKKQVIGDGVGFGPDGGIF